VIGLVWFGWFDAEFAQQVAQVEDVASISIPEQLQSVLSDIATIGVTWYDTEIERLEHRVQ
jgi:hypothetical protein